MRALIGLGIAAGRVLGCVIGGALVGLSSLALYGWWWGLALAAAATLAALIALPPGITTRIPYALGWLLPVGTGLVPRPEGDFAVASTVRGYALLALAMLVIVIAVATLRTARRAG